MLGRQVSELVNSVQDHGYKEVAWNACNVASGIYFYRLDATSLSDPTKHFAQTKKMVLIR
jgi:hypothetical protein